MKDINKGDLLEAIDSLPSIIKSQKRQIAQALIPDIQQFVHGCGRIGWQTTDGRLEVILEVKRTE